MATTYDSFPLHPVTFTAGEDIAVGNYFIGYDGKVCKKGKNAIGVLNDAADDTKPIKVYTGGVCLVEYAGTITAGDSVISDGEGHALTKLPTVVAIDKAADQAHAANATLTNDTHFTFTVQPNQVWIINTRLAVVNAKAAAQSLKWGFSVPAAATMVGQVNEGNSDGDTILNTEQYTSLLVAGAISTVIDLSETGYIEINGMLTVGATGGTVVLQHCQAVSDATALTVKAGSTFTALLEGTEEKLGEAWDAGVDGTLGRIKLI